MNNTNNPAPAAATMAAKPDETTPPLTSEDYRRMLLAELKQMIDELKSMPAHMFITREQLDAEIDELIRRRPFTSMRKNDK